MRNVTIETQTKSAALAEPNLDHFTPEEGLALAAMLNRDSRRDAIAPEILETVKGMCENVIGTSMHAYSSVTEKAEKLGLKDDDTLDQEAITDYNKDEKAALEVILQRSDTSIALGSAATKAVAAENQAIREADGTSLPAGLSGILSQEIQVYLEEEPESPYVPVLQDMQARRHLSVANERATEHERLL